MHSNWSGQKHGVKTIYGQKEGWLITMNKISPLICMQYGPFRLGLDMRIVRQTQMRPVVPQVRCLCLTCGCLRCYMASRFFPATSCLKQKCPFIPPLSYFSISLDLFCLYLFPTKIKTMKATRLLLNLMWCAQACISELGGQGATAETSLGGLTRTCEASTVTSVLPFQDNAYAVTIIQKFEWYLHVYLIRNFEWYIYIYI